MNYRVLQKDKAIEIHGTYHGQDGEYQQTDALYNWMESERNYFLTIHNVRMRDLPDEIDSIEDLKRWCILDALR